MRVPSSLKFTGKDPGIVGFEKQKLLRELQEKLKEKNKEKRVIENVDDSMMGAIPNLLIGSYNYPSVNTGFLASQEESERDNPKEWVKNPTIGIKDIILMRQSLANSRFKSDVKLTNKFSDKLKEVSLSSKALDAEVYFKGRMNQNFSFNTDTLPHGPIGNLKKLEVLENAKIPFHVQRAESDSDLKAKSAVNTLSERGIDEHFLTKIVSAGNLGTKLERRMVPTKWSITMVDDTLGLKYIKQIQQNENHPTCFFEGSYLGNYYFGLILPGPWSFELFEVYVGDLKNSSNYASATDYEGPLGRVKYADNTSGGYYASRLAALEYLKEKKMRGRVLMLRFITREYWAPLGVWVVREASRNTFKSKPQVFEDKKDMLQHAFIKALREFKININPMIRDSKLLKEINEQKTLF